MQSDNYFNILQEYEKNTLFVIKINLHNLIINEIIR